MVLPSHLQVPPPPFGPLFFWSYMCFCDLPFLLWQLECFSSFFTLCFTSSSFLFSFASLALDSQELQPPFFVKVTPPRIRLPLTFLPPPQMSFPHGLPPVFSNYSYEYGSPQGASVFVLNSIFYCPSLSPSVTPS